MKRLLFAVVLCCLLMVGLALAAQFKVGDVVYAEWVPNGWYHGKIDNTCAAGFHIQYDDGDTKCCASDQIVLDVVPSAANVKVGSRVLSQWSDGRFYPGTVTAIAGSKYSIQYDDGDTGSANLNTLRLR